MLAKLIPLMKLIAAIDGAVAALVAGVGQAYPSTQPFDLKVVGICGAVGAILAGVSKLVGVKS